MSVNYSIKSLIIDLKSGTPKDSDSFLIDSNVWYWMTYSSASYANSSPLPYQLKCYPDYIKSCLKAEVNLFHCIVSLNEISHLIEKVEYELYLSGNPEEINRKEYRHNNQSERERIISEIKSSWTQVESMSKPLELNIDVNASKNVLQNLDQAPLDGFDGLILEFMKKNGMNQIITDDGDFACTPGLKVFTANKNVIDAARKQGKIENRDL